MPNLIDALSMEAHCQSNEAILPIHLFVTPLIFGKYDLGAKLYSPVVVLTIIMFFSIFMFFAKIQLFYALIIDQVLLVAEGD